MITYIVFLRHCISVAPCVRLSEKSNENVYYATALSISESVVADDECERSANKERRLHPLPDAGDVITEMSVTSDRKRKCSNGDDDGCRYRSKVDVNRCELSKSTHPSGFTVERPITIRVSSAVIGPTPSPCTAVLRKIWSPSTYRSETTRSEPQVPVKRRPARREYADNDEKLSRLPVDVVDMMWQKNWSSAGGTRLIVEPTLCRESVLPVFLLSSSSGFCQLSN